MGSVSSAMAEGMKKNQIDMMENQKKMMLKQREMQMAMQVARARDMLMWQGAFYGTLAFAATAGFAKTRNPLGFAALVPLTFVLGYQYDMVYLNKMQRLRSYADQLIRAENERGLDNRFLPPDSNLLVSPEEYDAWIVVPHRFGSAPDDHIINK